MVHLRACWRTKVSKRFSWMVSYVELLGSAATIELSYYRQKLLRQVNECLCFNKTLFIKANDRPVLVLSLPASIIDSERGLCKDLGFKHWMDGSCRYSAAVWSLLFKAHGWQVSLCLFYCAELACFGWVSVPVTWVKIPLKARKTSESAFGLQ